jgi:2-polyprenyl-6-methoxyphenol hydroxylase-like FAD-dependent oxidoreductase
MIDPGAVTLGLPLAPTNVAMRLTFGLRGFFGYQVVASGELYWFENFGAADQIEREMLDAVPDAVWRQRLRERHREDHAPIPAIIEATEEAIGRWPIYDLSKLPTWHKGPIGLIGDAAYAISPHAGQGASLAFEDAIVLAMCLRDVNEVEQALTLSEALRRERVERIVAGARRIGNQKLPGNAPTRGVRDALLPHFLRQGIRSAEQTHAYRVDWSERVAD